MTTASRSDGRSPDSALAVAADAGDADDLAAPHVEIDARERRAERIVRRQVEAAYAQQRCAGARLAVTRFRQVAADHHPRERRRGLLARIAIAGDAAVTKDRRAIAQRADLVELVADVEDAQAFRDDVAQRGEQSLDRLRRQHRRRLVHDEELRLLQQAAHDFHTLALANRHRVHVARRVERQSIGRRHVAHPRGQCGVDTHAVERERDVVDDAQCLEQREMLEHHADAELARARRIGDDDRPPFPADRSGIGMRDAVDDLHQRRLAGAVLAEHGVDLARHDGQADAIVGLNSWIPLADICQREPGCWGDPRDILVGGRASTHSPQRCEFCYTGLDEDKRRSVQSVGRAKKQRWQRGSS